MSLGTPTPNNRYTRFVTTKIHFAIEDLWFVRYVIRQTFLTTIFKRATTGDLFFFIFVLSILLIVNKKLPITFELRTSGVVGNHSTNCATASLHSLPLKPIYLFRLMLSLTKVSFFCGKTKYPFDEDFVVKVCRGFVPKWIVCVRDREETRSEDLEGNLKHFVSPTTKSVFPFLVLLPTQR